ncbi:MAG TPA: ATP-binding protein [Thermoanaerobaculia bacterium]|nr:ATP-binding protein [Thermoanaerobaculia bacterium]
MAAVARRLRRALLLPAGAALAAYGAGVALELRPSTIAVLLGFSSAAAGLLIARRAERRFLDPLDALCRRVEEGTGLSQLERPATDDLVPLARGVQRLAGRCEEQLDTLEAERDHLRRLLERMSEGVLVVGTDGRAALVNGAFRRLFQVRGEPLGRAPLELVRLPELARVVERALGGSGEESFEVEVELADRRTLVLAGAALGRDEGALVVVRDTTAFTRLARMRREFVANVSHELKTPLAAIRGYVETLRDGALDDRPTAERFLSRVLAQCRRLQALLDDLLTLSRLESVETPLAMARVDLEAVAGRALDLVSELAREKDVRFVVEAADPPPVLGHAESLERLLVNLLDNGVKYNQPGGTVRLRLGRDLEGAKIEVEDTGIGIPTDALPRLFERFYRVDKGRSRDEGGTGLGLAIVKHIVSAHGGRVEVESREGVGSTFRVVLPAAKGPSAGG